MVRPISRWRHVHDGSVRIPAAFRSSRRRWLRLLCVASAAIFGLTGPARAEVRFSGLSFTPGSGILIDIVGIYDSLPKAGFAPVRVSIRNDSDRTRSWRFLFSCTSGYRGPQTQEYLWTASVESGRERAYELLIPLVPMQQHGYPSLQVDVRGHGLKSGRATYMANHLYTGRAHAPFSGFSSLLWPQLQGPLDQEMEQRGHQLVGCSLDPAMLSADWRAYVGFASIWMADGDWVRLGGAARAGILNWVGQGGRLFYCSPTPTEESLRNAGLPGSGTSDRNYGFGRITAVHWDGEPLQVSGTADRILGLAPDDHAANLSSLYMNPWPLRDLVPDDELNTLLIVTAILVFALIVGPVNLIFFAGRRRRFRLFWTTPVISIIASLALMGLILFQDGVGGEGGRVAVLHLLPDARQEVIIQEQISRTGLVVDPSYALSDSVYFAPIALAPRSNPRPQTLLRTAERCDGDWFSSRSLQAQYVSDVRPSRARFELLNADAVAAGRENPILLSAMEETLEEVYFVDSTGRYWRADSLPVGRKTELTESSLTTFRHDWWIPHIHKMGLRAGGRIDAMESREGYVYGVIASPTRSFIQTHRQIRWKHEKAVVMGPCVWMKASES